MKIMVSACLLGQNCKYNGGNNYCDKVASFLEGHEVIPVCPEVEGVHPAELSRYMMAALQANSLKEKEFLRNYCLRMGLRLWI